MYTYSQAKTQAVFEAKSQAKIFSIELPPCRIVISCDTNGIEEERTWSLNEGGELVQVRLTYRVTRVVSDYIGFVRVG